MRLKTVSKRIHPAKRTQRAQAGRRIRAYRKVNRPANVAQKPILFAWRPFLRGLSKASDKLRLLSYLRAVEADARELWCDLANLRLLVQRSLHHG